MLTHWSGTVCRAVRAIGEICKYRNHGARTFQWWHCRLPSLLYELQFLGHGGCGGAVAKPKTIAGLVSSDMPAFIVLIRMMW